MEVKYYGSTYDIPNRDNTTYLTFTQEEKTILKKLRLKKVSTIHEAQGKTYQHVICVRDNPRSVEIFNSQKHILVALTRHTESFVYYTKRDADVMSLYCKIKII